MIQKILVEETFVLLVINMIMHRVKLPTKYHGKRLKESDFTIVDDETVQLGKHLRKLEKYTTTIVRGEYFEHDDGKFVRVYTCDAGRVQVLPSCKHAYSVRDRQFSKLQLITKFESSGLDRCMKITAAHKARTSVILMMGETVACQIEFCRPVWDCRFMLADRALNITFMDSKQSCIAIRDDLNVVWLSKTLDTSPSLPGRILTATRTKAGDESSYVVTDKLGVQHTFSSRTAYDEEAPVFESDLGELFVLVSNDEQGLAMLFHTPPRPKTGAHTKVASRSFDD